MAEKVLGTVRDVAERVIAEYKDRLNIKMMDLLPKQLLEMDMTDDNLYEIELQVDYLRFAKERLLLWKDVNYRPGKLEELPPDLHSRLRLLFQKDNMEVSDWRRGVIDEIRFLACLATAIIHQ